MYEEGKLGRVTDEEDRRVIEDPIQNPFFGTHLDREAARISGLVGRASPASYSGKADGYTSVGPFLENVRARQPSRKIGRHFEEAMSTCSSSMHDSLWNSFPNEMRQSIDEMTILKQERPIGTRSLSCSR